MSHQNHGSHKQVSHVLSAGRKDLLPRILYPLKMSFRNYGNIKTFSHKGPLRKFFANKLSRRMAKGSALNRKKTIKESTSEYHKGGRNTLSKNMDKQYIFSTKHYKLCCTWKKNYSIAWCVSKCMSICKTRELHSGNFFFKREVGFWHFIWTGKMSTSVYCNKIIWLGVCVWRERERDRIMLITISVKVRQSKAIYLKPL